MTKIQCPKCDATRKSLMHDDHLFISDAVRCVACGYESSERDWSVVKEFPPCEAMIDIETLDTPKSAAVFQVGVVMFDADHNIVNKETWNLNVDEQLKLGRTLSASTLAFHLGIPANAKAALEDKNVVGLLDFITAFNQLFKLAEPKKVWAKGSFDFNILEDLYGGTNIPWKFYQVRELRTLMAECGVPKGDVAHTAIDDCIAQVAQLAKCRERIAKSFCEGTRKLIRDQSNTELTKVFDKAEKVDESVSVIDPVFSDLLDWNKLNSNKYIDHLDKIWNLINEFEGSEGKALVISGCQGSGKTTLSIIAANTFKNYQATTSEQINGVFGFSFLNAAEDAGTPINCVVVDDFDFSDYSLNIKALISTNMLNVHRKGAETRAVATPKLIFISRDTFDSKGRELLHIDLDNL